MSSVSNSLIYLNPFQRQTLHVYPRNEPRNTEQGFGRVSQKDFEYTENGIGRNKYGGLLVGVSLFHRKFIASFYEGWCWKKECFIVWIMVYYNCVTVEPWTVGDRGVCFDFKLKLKDSKGGRWRGKRFLVLWANKVMVTMWRFYRKSDFSGILEVFSSLIDNGDENNEIRVKG